MKRIAILTGLIFIVLWSNCTKAIIDEGETMPIPETITYNDHIQSIMLNNCVTCHSGVSPSAGLDLSTYQAVKSSAENGTLLTRVEDVSNPMPPNGLMSAELRAQIAKWAEDGFPE